MSKVRRMFLGSNSSLGFYSLFEELFSEDLHRYFIIKGGPGTGKSVFMKRIGKNIEKWGLNIEYYHCSSDKDSIDGIFIPTLKVALVDGTAPHIIEPKYPGIIDDILNFAQFLDRDQLLPHKGDILKLSKKSSMYFKKAYMKLKQASIVLDEISLEYIKPVTDQIAKELISQIFKGISDQKTKPFINIRKFFASAITPQGIYKYFDSLIEHDMEVYKLNGFMGLDTQDIFTKLINYAYGLGLDMEVYYCPFRPDNIDMIIIPSLEVAVMGTSPLYKETNIICSIQEKIVEIPISSCRAYNPLVEEFNKQIESAIVNIGKAKSKHDDLESIYAKAMDFDGVDRLYSHILDTIKTQAEL